MLIEDDRDVELLYRSAGNLLCAAAPLVEPIPDEFLGCTNTTLSAGDGVQPPPAYKWYGSTILMSTGAQHKPQQCGILNHQSNTIVELQ